MVLTYSTFKGDGDDKDDRSDGSSQRGLRLLLVRALTCVSACAEGYDLGIIAGVVVLCREEFALTELWLALIVALFSVSLAAGALVGGPIADGFGRKGGLLFIYAALITGVSVMVAAPGRITFLVGRCLQGLSVGAAFCVVGAYMSELAPARRRGVFVSLEAIFLNVGILAGVGANYVLLGATGSTSTDWRLMVGLAAVLPSLCLLCLALPNSLVPESPRWLHLQGRTDEALAVLRLTLDKDEVAKVEAQWSQRGAAAGEEAVSSWAEVVRPADARDQRSLRQGIGVAMAQMASGITVLLYYSDYILTHDLDHRDAFLGMVIVAFAKLAVLILSCFFLDYIGRRPLLCLSSGLMSLALAGLGACYLLGAAPWTKVLVLACCIACFSLGLGGGAYVVVSEVFSNRLRARGSALAFCSSRLLSGIINFSFPFLSQAISMGGAFLVYSCLCFLGFLFICVCVSETAGRTLETMET